jgi:3-methyladenine DNA glycosylase AlkD
MNTHHHEILRSIKKLSGKPTQHTFVDSYLGTTHTRYPMNNPTMRTIAKEFIKSHVLNESSFTELLSSLIEGKSFTEKSIAGFMLDYAGKRLWTFDPLYFDQWLNYLEGWAEIDTLCTGKYSATVSGQSGKWKKLLGAFSKSDRIEKRRASLVFCCRPLSKQRDEHLLKATFQNIKRLQPEKDVLITKAISWVLRSAIPYHKAEVKEFVNKNLNTLPKIAVRETLVKLETGRKTKLKKSV